MEYGIGEWLHYNFAFGRFQYKNAVAEYIRHKLNFIYKNGKFIFSHPLGNLRVTYALFWLAGKPVVDFLFVIIELTVETI